jgi:hypothetical protein
LSLPSVLAASCDDDLNEDFQSAFIFFVYKRLQLEVQAIERFNKTNADAITKIFNKIKGRIATQNKLNTDTHKNLCHQWDIVQKNYDSGSEA